MNERCVEIGWLITDKGEEDVRDPLAIFEALGKVCPNANDDGYIVLGTKNHPDGWCPESLQVETHPNLTRRVFISHHELGHGQHVLAEPPLLGKWVRKFLDDYVPNFSRNYHLGWGIIETER